MKTALVLGGGGSKGAYEVGVWKALRECGISIDIVTGTSIGAMIGAMVVQDQYEECYQLWDQLTIDDVVLNGVNVDFDIELLMSQKGKYKTIMQTYVANKGADISPFERMIHNLFDEERFFSSSVDFACMSVNLSKHTSHAFTKEEMHSAVDPHDALLASAACFPAFPMRTIHGDHYVDGGYYDNVPIKLARSMGAEQIIAVDLKSVGTKKLWKPQQDVIYIEPYVPLGSFLLFDHERIHRNMHLGYQDAMKKFGRYLGYIYTFSNMDQNAIDEFELAFEKFCSSFSLAVGHERVAQLYHTILTHQVLSTLKEYTEYDHPYLRILELCAYVFDLPDEEIYVFSAFIKKLIKYIDTYTPSYDKLFDELKSAGQIIEVIKDFSSSDILFYIYQRLLTHTGETTKLIKLLAVAKPDIYLLSEMMVFLRTEWRVQN